MAALTGIPTKGLIMKHMKIYRAKPPTSNIISVIREVVKRPVASPSSFLKTVKNKRLLVV